MGFNNLFRSYPIKNQYIVVVMENPNQIVAIIDQQDNMILDILFKMLMMLIQNKNIPRNEKNEQGH